mgnify:CR=1 FL=1
MTSPAPTAEHQPVVGKLSTLDRFLPVWIGVAMVVGLLLGLFAVAVVVGDVPGDSVDAHVADTLTAGAGLCDAAAVASILADGPAAVTRLRARGVEVEYMIKADEGHGFVNPENTIDMFRATERFLAQHIGGRTEQA